jgi:ATP adenylyltransferase
MSRTPLLNIDNARTEEQRKLMEQIQRDGVCPFCKEYFSTYHPKPIIKETDYWYFTENMSPYAGTKHHFIFVYKPEHIENPSVLSPEEVTDLFSLLSWATERFSIRGGSFFMRFGESKYTGSSVAHLHAHLLMGDVDAPDHTPVRVKLG